MYKATREFLKLRPNAKIVNVELINFDGTKPNHCYQNACLYADSNEMQRMVMSGWLVGEFLGERGTAIIPHYWVFDEVLKRYFDPTPKNINDKQIYEYVEDIDIMQYGNSNSILPPPLRLTANGTFDVKLDGEIFKPIQKIDVAELYSMQSD